MKFYTPFFLVFTFLIIATIGQTIKDKKNKSLSLKIVGPYTIYDTFLYSTDPVSNIVSVYPFTQYSKELCINCISLITILMDVEREGYLVNFTHIGISLMSDYYPMKDIYKLSTFVLEMFDNVRFGRISLYTHMTKNSKNYFVYPFFLKVGNKDISYKDNLIDIVVKTELKMVSFIFKGYGTESGNNKSTEKPEGDNGDNQVDGTQISKLYEKNLDVKKMATRSLQRDHVNELKFRMNFNGKGFENFEDFLYKIKAKFASKKETPKKIISSRNQRSKLIKPKNDKENINNLEQPK
jgi:hypothetical protein